MAHSKTEPYVQALAALAEGRFDIAVPDVAEDDGLRELGNAIVHLADTLQHRFKEMDLLADLSERVNSGGTLDDVLNYLFDAFRPYIPYNRIGLSLLDESGCFVEARWARSDADELFIPKGYVAPLLGSSLDGILATSQPRIINDLEAYLREHPQSISTRLIVAEGMRSSLTCPLKARGRPVGFVFFSSRLKDAYRNAHAELYVRIAQKLSMIVEKSRLYERLIELSELKSRFIGMAAHDLRGPLTAVNICVKMLGKPLWADDPARRAQLIETMHVSTKALMSMLDSLLDVNTAESGRLRLELEEVNLLDLLRERVAIYRVIADEKAISLELDAVDLPPVRADRERICQVVDNLVTNAIKFSPRGAAVILRARCAEGVVRVSVIDEGPGIPPEELRELFSAYRRTSILPTDGERSTGLGLAIAPAIVDAHGGRLTVESEVGVGSTFTFVLPVPGKDQ